MLSAFTRRERRGGILHAKSVAVIKLNLGMLKSDVKSLKSGVNGVSGLVQTEDTHTD
jgi:hypothetical protein